MKRRHLAIACPLLLPIFSGCALIPAADRSAMIANQKVAVTINTTTLTANARTLRIVSLVPTFEAADAQQKAFPAAAVAAAAIPLAVEGVGWLYDYVVDSIRDEAKQYTATYSADATVDGFYKVTSIKNCEVPLDDAELQHWLQAAPDSYTVTPASVTAEMNRQFGRPHTDFSYTEIQTLRLRYNEIHDRRMEVIRASQGRAIPTAIGAYTLRVVEIGIATPGAFSLERTFDRGDGQEKGLLAEGSIVLTRGGMQLQLDRLRLGAAAAKVPDEWFFIPANLVSDEFESRVDLSVVAKIEEELVGEDGLRRNEVIFEGPLVELKGIDLTADPIAEGSPYIYDWQGKARTALMRLPRLAGSLHDAAEVGCVRVELRVVESNDLGPAIANLAAKAEEERKGLLEKLEEQLNDLTENLKRSGGDAP